MVNETLIVRDEVDDDDEKCNNSVTIINRLNGLIETSFVISEDFNQMQLYLDKFLITIHDISRSLKCFNFKGDLLNDITLEKKLEGSLIGVMNKELCLELRKNKFFLF
jgi:hypothetical protein